MIKTALSSAAMLGATIDDVLANATQAGVHAIEWSTDGFLDSGDLKLAGELMLKTLRSGLTVASYASLYRVGVHTIEEFDKILDTACALHAPMIRIWAPPVHEGSYSERRLGDEIFIEAAKVLGDKASRTGITLSLSPARGSMINSWSRAACLIAGVDHPFVKLAWEPAPDLSFDQSMEIFSRISGHVGMIVSRSLAADGTIHTLCQRDEEWSLFLDAFDEQGGAADMARYVVVRAFKDNCPQNLKADVELLNFYSQQLRRYHRRRLL